MRRGRLQALAAAVFSAMTDRGSSRRARSEPRAGWHQEGLGLESMRVGDRMPGIVCSVASFGTFVDVGARRNAKLLVEPRFKRKFAAA